MIMYGVSANEHDAGLTVVRDDEILFASHAERYSRRKNDAHLNDALIAEARAFGDPDVIVWYEKPFLKRTRKLWAGQYSHVFRPDGAAYLAGFGLKAPVRYRGHHECHAAAGFFTSPFEKAAILVVDAIGEWDTISAWQGEGRTLRKIWSQGYPHSLGLLYSAFTDRIGLKPNEEEYILMGRAAFGKPLYRERIIEDFIASFDPPTLILKENVHRGIKWWLPDCEDHENIAASIQHVTEEVMIGIARWLAAKTEDRNLVLTGGLALNCVVNSCIARAGLFDDIWIMPNPGDAGSSLGAVAAYSRRQLIWKHPYLGHHIDRPFDMEAAVKALQDGEIIGVANGRAEFGPRALGNRSLLTDPRGPHVKDRVNQVKQREPFRPFAPMIMADHAPLFFDMPVKTSPYMQFVAAVKHPEMFPAITHHDGTARVQTLTCAQNSTVYELLRRFHARTGCPMLLNTSLNIKGEPLVNTWADAERFAALWGVKMF
jgi:carbamoyltransferase